MTAEVLRRAAALMRERAEAATSSPWHYENGATGFAPMVVGDSMAVAETFDKPHLSDAQHIASWHPAVALAVADWLDATAAEHESDAADPRVNSFFAAFDTAADFGAIAVARAYLGEQS